MCVCARVCVCVRVCACVCVCVLLLSHARLSVAPWTVPRQASLSITISQNLHKLMSIESVMPSNPLLLCIPPSPPGLNLSQH